MFGNTWGSLGAGWSLPLTEFISYSARLEFLPLRPICRDFITLNFKGVRLLLDRSPINYLCWTLYKGLIFYLVPSPCDWYPGNRNLRLQAATAAAKSSAAHKAQRNSEILLEFSRVLCFLIAACVQWIITNVFSKLLVYFLKVGMVKLLEEAVGTWL